jgi:hypothetical protein
MQLQAVNSWAAIQHLRDTDPEMTERRIREIAKIQGLDLPHTPGIRPEYGPRGVAFWRVYCLGCTHDTGRVAMACALGRWSAPGQLVDAYSVLSEVDAALTGPQPEEIPDEFDPSELLEPAIP